MLQKGNEKMNTLYNPGNTVAPPYTKDMEQFIRDKYERKIFMSERDKKNILRMQEQDRAKNVPTYLPLDINYQDKTKFDGQLKSLKEMGFDNPTLNLVSLKACHGDLQKAIDYLVSDGRSSSNSGSSNNSFVRKPTSGVKIDSELPSYSSSVKNSFSSLEISLLDKLKKMGFLNRDLNIKAMKLSNWKIEQAINYIVSHEESKDPEFILTPPPPALKTTLSASQHTSLVNLMDKNSQNSSLSDLSKSISSELKETMTKVEKPGVLSFLDELSGLNLEIPSTKTDPISTKDSIMDLFVSSTDLKPLVTTTQTLLTETQTKSASSEEFSDFMSSRITVNNPHIPSSPADFFIKDMPQSKLQFKSSVQSAPSSSQISPKLVDPMHNFHDSQYQSLGISIPRPSSSVNLTGPALETFDPFADLASEFKSFTLKKPSLSSYSTNLPTVNTSTVHHRNNIIPPPPPPSMNLNDVSLPPNSHCKSAHNDLDLFDPLK